MDLTMVLSAYELTVKHGFQDGHVVSEFWCVCNEENNGLKRLPEYKIEREHEILIYLIRKYLMPLLRGVEIYELKTCHNPVRCEDESLSTLHVSKISVEINWQNVHDAIVEVNEKYSDVSE